MLENYLFLMDSMEEWGMYLLENGTKLVLFVVRSLI